MRAILALLVVLALALLAGGLWFLVQGGAGEGRDRDGLTRDGVDEIADARSSDLELPGQARADSGSGDPGARAALEGSVPSAGDAATTRGSLRRVRGRVVDEFAAPIGGAVVFWAPLRASGGLQLDRVPASSFWLEVESVETDAAGEFELDVRFRDDLRLAVRAAGFAPLRTQRTLAPTGECSLADLVMEGSVILSGHVVDRSGRGVPNAELHQLSADQGGFRIAFFDRESEPLTRTDAGGAFTIDQLAAGPHRLRIRHADHPDHIAEGSVERPGETVADLRFVLDDGLTISGHVLGIGRGEHAKYQVRATPTFDSFRDSLGDFGSYRTVEIASNGGFEVRGLRAESTYRLTVIDAATQAAFIADSRSSMVHALAGETGVKLELREPFALTFAVVDASSGAPVTRFEVEAGRPWMEKLRDEQGEVQGVHPEGVVHYRDVPAPAGQATTDLRLRADGYETVFLEDLALEPGAEKDLGVIRLHAVPSVLVRVLDAATGEAVEGARVSLARAQDRRSRGRAFSMRLGDDEEAEDLVLPGSTPANRGVTDATGLATLASMPGERCRISVRHRGYAEYVGEPVDLPARIDLELEVKLLLGGTVIVHVVDPEGNPAAGSRVEHLAPEDDSDVIVLGGRPSRRTRSDGTATFRRLPAGVHHFSLGDDGSPSFIGGGQIVIGGVGAGSNSADGVEVVVAEGSTHEITLREPLVGRLSGVVTESGQPLAGASISFRPKKEGGEEDDFFIPGFGGDDSVRTDGRGRYEIEDLSVGEYLAIISHPGRAMDAELGCTVSEGVSKRDFVLEVNVLEGRVTDSTGEPVEGIEVFPRRAGPATPRRTMVFTSIVSGDGGGGGAMSFSAGSGSQVSARTDRDGRYSIRGVLADVEIHAETRSEHFQPGRSETVVVNPGQTLRGADIEVFSAGAISLTVRRSDGPPGGFCMADLVYLDDEAGEGAEPRHEFVGESGRVRVVSLRPGRWRITVRSVPMGGEGEAEEASPIEVLVSPGETAEAVVDLP